ncbi:hypothetical protein O1363_18470 [Bacteroides fragilis]|jgi:hypothetical protein|uniref:hypothetical protein n=1 Tax=Bacteroides fragilis TaxID=817 RepID=UPI00046EAA9D|nr:hypothetical protein [Bacteroides fragilis]MCE8807164.1 hypothetical protein [Bacteroides fragilis]MCE8810819.1 hypothetical protein [Bacteroides fragilis]MCE8819819.1 hypothetical protein [Bacteroides fragilis]MCE9112185.1 hypothetical protein [Bacteroides fragilis]MCS3315224.1 hypothetical protein [Bacteroides fragilis]
MRNQANKATPDRRLEQIDGYHGIVCGTLEIGQYHYMGTDKKPIKAEDRIYASVFTWMKFTTEVHNGKS